MMEQHTPELMFQFSDELDLDNDSQRRASPEHGEHARESETQAQHSRCSSKTSERDHDHDHHAFVLGGGRARAQGGGQATGGLAPASGRADHDRDLLPETRTASVTARTCLLSSAAVTTATSSVGDRDRHVNATAAALVAAAGPLRIETAETGARTTPPVAMATRSVRQCRTPQYGGGNVPPRRMSSSAAAAVRGIVGSVPDDAYSMPLGSPVGSHKVRVVSRKFTAVERELEHALETGQFDDPMQAAEHNLSYDVGMLLRRNSAPFMYKRGARGPFNHAQQGAPQHTPPQHAQGQVHHARGHSVHAHTSFGNKRGSAGSSGLLQRAHSLSSGVFHGLDGFVLPQGRQNGHSLGQQNSTGYAAAAAAAASHNALLPLPNTSASDAFLHDEYFSANGFDYSQRSPRAPPKQSQLALSLSRGHTAAAGNPSPVLSHTPLSPTPEEGRLVSPTRGADSAPSSPLQGPSQQSLAQPITDHSNKSVPPKLIVGSHSSPAPVTDAATSSPTISSNSLHGSPSTHSPHVLAHAHIDPTKSPRAARTSVYSPHATTHSPHATTHSPAACTLNSRNSFPFPPQHTNFPSSPIQLANGTIIDSDKAERMTGGGSSESSSSSDSDSDTDDGTSVSSSDSDVGAAAASAKLGLSDFRVLQQVGRGYFGVVYLVELRDTGEKFAMKVLKKSHVISENVVDMTHTERDVLVLVAASHPFIVDLHFAFQTPTKLYLILDFIPGGEILRQIVSMKPDQTVFYIAEIILAIEHLHDLNIIYRDVKPENILIAGDGHACITDFGVSKMNVGDTQESKSFCGTLEYMAPEIVQRKGHGKASDWWSVGCLLFEFITGNSPFTGNRAQVQKQILTKKVKLPTKFSAMNPHANDLIRKLLTRATHKRLGSKGSHEIKKHPYFRKIDWNDLLEKRVEPPFCPVLKSDEDTSYFDTSGFASGNFSLSESSPAVTPHDSAQALFKGFSFYSRESAAIVGVPASGEGEGEASDIEDDAEDDPESGEE